MESNGFIIVERIDRLLSEKKLKRAALAEAVGIKAQTISAWSTRGTVPAADIAIKMAEFLDVSVEWLIAGEDKTGYTPEDRRIISAFHELGDSAQRTVLTLLNHLADEARQTKNEDVQIS